MRIVRGEEEEGHDGDEKSQTHTQRLAESREEALARL